MAKQKLLEAKLLIPVYGIKRSIDMYDVELIDTKPRSKERLRAIGRAFVRTNFALFYNAALFVSIYKGLEALVK